MTFYVQKKYKDLKSTNFNFQSIFICFHVTHFYQQDWLGFRILYIIFNCQNIKHLLKCFQKKKSALTVTSKSTKVTKADLLQTMLVLCASTAIGFQRINKRINVDFMYSLNSHGTIKIDTEQPHTDGGLFVWMIYVYFKIQVK